MPERTIPEGYTYEAKYLFLDRYYQLRPLEDPECMYLELSPANKSDG